MKYKLIFYLTLFAVFTTCLTVFPGGGTSGALNGVNMCYNIIIPSLFPFMVASLLIYKIINQINVSKKSGFFACFGNYKILIFLISLIGGYPVGAKLIDEAYKNGVIKKLSGEKMLGFCVNSGPSFVVIAVGSGILKNEKLGLILLASNIIASIIIALLLFKTIENPDKSKQANNFIFSDEFVISTYDASKSIFNICSFIVVFSSIIGTLNAIFNENVLIVKIITLTLEITNGILIAGNNIIVISFLLGFSGFCVHFQVLSVCKNLKPNYLRFLSFRILHGLLSAIITFALIKIFKFPIQTIAVGGEYLTEISRHSVIFSIALILCSIIFISSTRKNCKIL